MFDFLEVNDYNGRATCDEQKDACIKKVISRESNGKRSLGKPHRRWLDSVKRDLIPKLIQYQYGNE